MRQFKVRFHLGAGENFMHWRVENTKTGEVFFYNPEKFRLIMHNCYLRNQKSAANKINQGANKSVCAWVECESVYKIDPQRPKNSIMEFKEFFKYNPRITPYWRSETDVNIDGKSYSKIVSKNNKLGYWK